MKNNILTFTRIKSKKRYRIIAIFIFVSIIIMNLLLQTMSLSIQTIHNEMLNSTNLSLILLQDSKKSDNNAPYDADVSLIEKIKNVKFVTKSKYLGLNGENKNGEQEGFITHAINPKFAYYVGIKKMEENKVYCSTKKYKNVEQYKLIDVNSAITLISYDADVPLILSDSCFVSTNTYDKIYKNLPSGYTEAVLPEYLIGVNNVKNVFGVVKQIDNLYTDDDTMMMYQANGLEKVVSDSSNLLWILGIVFIIFLIFNTVIISFLSSSLVTEISRDLMVLYLNGMSRRSISSELNKHCRSCFGKAIIIASVLSIIAFICIMTFVLKQQISIYWLLLLICIDGVVICINTLTIKLLIHKVVNKKTSNNNISKIIRN